MYIFHENVQSSGVKFQETITNNSTTVKQAYEENLKCLEEIEKNETIESQYNQDSNMNIEESIHSNTSNNEIASSYLFRKISSTNVGRI